MNPKPHSDFTAAKQPQHELSTFGAHCRRCGKGLQQIEHGAECVSDDAIRLSAVVGRMRRAAAR